MAAYMVFCGYFHQQKPIQDNLKSFVTAVTTETMQRHASLVDSKAWQQSLTPLETRTNMHACTHSGMHMHTQGARALPQIKFVPAGWLFNFFISTTPICLVVREIPCCGQLIHSTGFPFLATQRCSRPNELFNLCGENFVETITF